MAEHGSVVGPERDEIEEKTERIRSLLRRRGLSAVLLRRTSSFAWITGGAASAINTATDAGVGEVLVTERGRYLVTNDIEAPRFEREDRLAGLFELVSGPWHTGGGSIAALAGPALGADLAPAGGGAVELAADVARLRAALTPVEGERFRDLGRRCGAAIGAAARRLEPGMTEHRVAAILAEETIARGVWPVVDLVATDERIAAYRHPLPVDGAVFDRHVMMVLCGRRHGLVCSVTRFVHVGPLPDELARRQRATAEVDATFLAATRPGATQGEVLARAVARYEATGFGAEWRLHHQGGPAGYEPREWVAVPGQPDVVARGQAYAWNPSITGTKSEDSLLVGEGGNEIVTAEPGWPTVEVAIDGRAYARPAVLTI